MVFVIPMYVVRWRQVDVWHELRVSDTDLESFLRTLRFNRITTFQVQSESDDGEVAA